MSQPYLKSLEVFGFRQTGIDGEGCAKGHFYATGSIPAVCERLQQLGIELPESLFEKRTLTGVEGNGADCREIRR